MKAEWAKARPPVVVTVNGFSFRSTVAVYGGRSHVGLRRDYREAAGVEIGELISLSVELDEAPRVVALPKDLAAALKKKPARSRSGRRSASATRRSTWGPSKKHQTRARRITAALALLTRK